MNLLTRNSAAAAGIRQAPAPSSMRLCQIHVLSSAKVQLAIQFTASLTEAACKFEGIEADPGSTRRER
jgi:hypothetical protein